MAESMSKSIGTDAFNSPEIHLRQAYDQSSDIFSLGVTLIYMFAGAYPFNFDGLSKSFKELAELTNPNITDII
jgi:serine/threonine protein kinase